MKTRARPPTGLGFQAIGEEEKQLVNAVLDSGHLNRFIQPGQSKSSMASQLEKELSDLVGVPYCLAVTSGTAALEVGMLGLGLGPGDEVILPAWSWKSCYTAIVRTGATPVLAEIDKSLMLAPGEIRRLRTSQTKAVVILHFQGSAARMDVLLQEAEECEVPVIEDCAQSPGTTFRGQRVASFGRLGIYSFQHNKTITCGEGGAVFTKDPELFERMVRAHDLGQFRSVFEERVQPSQDSFCGDQFRMPELTAAVALAQVRKLDAIRAHCRSLQKIVRKAEADYVGFEPRMIPDPEGDSGFVLYYFFESEKRAQAINVALSERNVNNSPLTGTYAQYSQDYCRHRLAHHPEANPFRSHREWPAKGYRAEDFPVTQDLVHRMISIPFGWKYTKEDAEYIRDSLIEVSHLL